VLGWHEADHAATERRLRQAWKRFDDTPAFWN
jgi:hypothetical protein